MKKSRFSDEQIVKILREADRGTVAQAAKEHAVSEQTIYTWRKRFGTLQTCDVKRLRELERENSRLKKLVAERDLEIDVMKEIQAKKGERARTSSTGRLGHWPRPVAAASVRASLRISLELGIRITIARPRCSDSLPDAGVGPRVSALRVPADSGLS